MEAGEGERKWGSGRSGKRGERRGEKGKGEREGCVSKREKGEDGKVDRWVRKEVPEEEFVGGQKLNGGGESRRRGRAAGST